MSGNSGKIPRRLLVGTQNASGFPGIATGQYRYYWDGTTFQPVTGELLVARAGPGSVLNLATTTILPVPAGSQVNIFALSLIGIDNGIFEWFVGVDSLIMGGSGLGSTFIYVPPTPFVGADGDDVTFVNVSGVTITGVKASLWYNLT